ncbi:MAG TPA: hypothetical protein VHQ20_02400 [Patescibacteria group bacterium]|jgi:magnesium-transporting ATPase (P-type)|nr:hypothetical protein [Patescibacteria group bacterium]
MPELETKKSENADQKKQLSNKKILAFSLEFGFMIVIPLVVFAFVGKWLSTAHHNKGFLYGGIVLALITSTVWFWKRITDIYNDYIN